jgi:hypothetical protein
MRVFNLLAASIALALLTSQARGNLVLNGDFENNSAASSIFNMSNSSFDAVVADATAFGTAEELDLVTGNDFGIPPQSGNWKVGLHTQPIGTFDAFSLTLSSALVVGESYNLKFYAAADINFLSGVDVGLSTSATDFGTLHFIALPASVTDWTEYNFSFVASSAATFLTVQSITPDEFYTFVDNFSLNSAVPEPSALAMGTMAAAAGLGLMHRRRS